MTNTSQELANARRYLERFGYIAAEPLSLFGYGDQKALDSDSDIVVAIKAFQQFNSLEITGELDAPTLHLMSTPRCGFPDAPFGTFVAHGNKWAKTTLTYGFVETTPDLGDARVRALTAEVLARWSAVTPLNFEVRNSGLPDIVFRFVHGDHGDGSPFDGPNGVLAHAYYPPPNGGEMAGDMHFDEAEKWVESGSGYDYPSVALHEAGHALGLAHSPVQASVMYAYYGGPRRALHADDIAGIQSLYGARATPPPPPPDPPGPAITADGWVTWAIRMPRTDGATRTNPGTNAVKGVFMHSAEGYATTLLDLALNGPLSWQFSNLFDGRLIQHWPLTARCWHATAANNDYVGVENEGKSPENPTLNEVQIANAVRLIKDIAVWKGWTPKRPTSTVDTSHTLWEHREVTRIGGSGSLCPSGRIPWPEILTRLGATPAPPAPNLPTTAQAAHAAGFLYPAFHNRDKSLLHPFDAGIIERMLEWYRGDN